MKTTTNYDLDSPSDRAPDTEEEDRDELMQSTPVRELATSDLKRAILLIATRQQAWGDREQWAFCLHAAGQDSPLCRDVTSFKTPALGDSIRAHALHLYALCPFTVNFRSVVSELGYATATLRTQTQNWQGNLMIAPQPV